MIILSDGECEIIDNLTIVTGEFNFKGFMKNYFKDLLNHYKIALKSRQTVACKISITKTSEVEFLTKF